MIYHKNGTATVGLEAGMKERDFDTGALGLLTFATALVCRDYEKAEAKRLLKNVGKRFEEIYKIAAPDSAWSRK